MIEKIFYTENSTYIDDDKGCTIRSDDLSIQQAMQLAFDTHSKFEYEKGNQWILRQCIHAFSRITNTRNFFDFATDISLHLLNNHIIKDFEFSINNGFEYLFDLMLEQEWEHGYKNIDNDLIECYFRDGLYTKLDEYYNRKDDRSMAMARKYTNIISDYKNYTLKDIQHEIWADNEDMLNYKVISWIDVDYCRHQRHMVLSGYNSNGDEIFSKLIEDVSQDEAEKTYNNIYQGMKSADFYTD